MARVPSIPQSALENISDRNIYAVLKAISDMLNVRNGQTGDSDNAFVTRAEVANLRGGGTIIGVAGAAQTQGGTYPVIKPSDIARVINDLQAQVMESPLFKALGERVNKVDAPGTGVIAQLDEERTVRSDAVASLVQQVTTLTAGVDANTAALQQEAQVRADADGHLMGQWSVKTDINGYVSGFGLMSTANNDVPFSGFIVRADRFAIGSPSGPGVPSRIPFIVVTTEQWVNGYRVPPGVYIDAAAISVASIGEAQIQFAAIKQAHIHGAAIGSAQIQDAAITNAKIGNAEIDTLKLQGETVTIPRAATGTGNMGNVASVYVPGGASAVVVSGTVNVPGITFGNDGPPIAQASITLTRDGVTLTSYDVNVQAEKLAIPLAWHDQYSGGGTYAISVIALGNVTATIACLGCKR
ncbi:hypothetical protein BKK79_01005 [Cupriavidus sp. USMAA2-4]|uniref:phage tail tip fiber protein n=1 Tax=Cupriavidus sp. USMAA2-4 TaxID=876364 RepID=UPI0008A69944|nr:DUF1983 domain-containing protein [Cupriavidus sp. USMAA2-4]AOY90564.1 hypothetical protein BKK79_01005 [Cupriavidus sp. USMAA2-4]